MHIFNETLKVNQIKCNGNNKLKIYENILLTSPIIIILLHIIIKNEQLSHSLLCMWIFLCMFVIYNQPHNTNKINLNNPLSKLYPVKEQVCLDLINLWQIYNKTQNTNHSISLYENKINSLFEKLDYELMNMLETQDKHTLKLLNLEDIDSYTKLYMLIIAPQEVYDIKYQIQDLHKKITDSKSFYLLENLEKIEQEIDEKHLNENYYFEYKKWYKGIEEQLGHMNDEKYIHEQAKKNYKQIIKDMSK